MKQVLIDTNALVSFFTDRDEKQRKDTAKLLGEALKGEIEIVFHQHVLSEMIFTLLNVYGEEPERVAEILRDTVNHPGVLLESELKWETLLNLWPSVFKDFGDAILASVAKDRHWPIFTFDKTFGKGLICAKIRWANPPKFTHPRTRRNDG